VKDGTVNIDHNDARVSLFKPAANSDAGQCDNEMTIDEAEAI
jgi:hypothetical protein